MTANPSIEALRKALEAVKESGDWHREGRSIVVNESEEWAEARIECRVNRLLSGKLAGYVLACKPDNIRTLLALVDAQEAQKARLLTAVEWLHANYKSTLARRPVRDTEEMFAYSHAAIDSAMKGTK